MQTTKPRRELHEFGVFTVEVWEEDEGNKVAVKAQACVMGSIMLFRKLYEPFETVKAGRWNTPSQSLQATKTPLILSAE
jgi:hypothetical protein